MAYADNIFLIGPMEQCFQCAEEVKGTMFDDLDLYIQIKSLWVHVPAWAHPGHGPTATLPYLPRLTPLAVSPPSEGSL
eukprot:778102-Rhodomonas_salina.1